MGNLHSPAKLLLFGEYAVLSGSEALAIPLSNFETRWTPGDESSSQYDLAEFARYLKTVDLPFRFDHASFEAQLHAGWYLSSNIPQGYGLGSSGAVVATLLKQFAEGIDTSDPKSLQNQLAQIESYFHGTSSGLDPLVCFLEKPVYLKKGGEIEILNQVDKSMLDNFYLLDSRQSRQTAPLVNLYKKKLKEPGFKTIIENRMVPEQDRAISAILHGQKDALEKSLANISNLQLEYFSEMILPSFVPAWTKGLGSGKFFMKLCGAGGGGFFLVYSGFPPDEISLPLIPLS